MVRYARQSDSSKKDCVVLRKPRTAVRWHQRALAQVALAGPIELRRLDPPRPSDLESAPHSVQADGHDLLTDPVAGDDCNLVGRHGLVSPWPAEAFAAPVARVRRPASAGIRRGPQSLQSSTLPKTPEVTAGIEPAEVLQTFRLPPADRLF